MANQIFSQLIDNTDYMAERLVKHINECDPNLRCRLVTNPASCYGGLKDDPIMVFVESVSILTPAQNQKLQYFVDGFIRAWSEKKQPDRS